ncbi:MAG: HAMP domain-containing protein, partial [Isosphaeraceae bacterium]|nr:HAMP domain-containing protein [Isosphaeraceae bacterium]
VYLLMSHHLLALTDAALREELVELGDEVGRAGGLARLPAVLALRFASHEGYEFQVSTMAGAPLFRSAGLGPGGLPRPDARPTSSGEPAYERITLDGIGPVRMASRVVPGPSGPLLIQAIVTLAPNARALRELVIVLLSTGPLALACALGGGYWLARRALAPVDRMTATAAEITATRLDQRLDEPGTEDELGRLARTFNAMIARLQRSFEEVRRFTADAAHELRTPLAAMRTEAEVALRSPRSPERDGRVLEDLLEEIERLTRLVSQLLFLCREDTGIGAGDFRPVRLDELVREVGEHMQVAAREKGVELDIELPTPCPVQGDADRLRRLFFNLIDNAIKYTPTGGRVMVRGESPNGQIHMTIADTGIGIPAEHLPYVFDRFYRVNPSRSPETDGTGLGLAICRSIVEAHGGRIEIDSVVGSGTRIRLALPMQGEARPGRARHGTLQRGSAEITV